MASVLAEALDTEKPPARLHSEAVRRTLSVGQDLKTEMLGEIPMPRSLDHPVM